MNLSEILMMQKQLDSRIEALHAVPKNELFDKKKLALMVELGELANETRCFKFWSLKPASPREQILDEFADGLHFVLSLYLLGYEEMSLTLSASNHENDITNQFLFVYQLVTELTESSSKSVFHQLICAYLHLGELLGLNEGEIFAAYCTKNNVNHQRQDTGY